MSKGMLLFLLFLCVYICVYNVSCVYFMIIFCLKYVKLHSKGYNAWEAWDEF